MVKNVLLFYIGNGVIKSSLISFSFSNNSPSLPKILLVEREQILENINLSKDELESLLLRKMDKLVQRVQKAILELEVENRKIDTTLLIFSAPWYLSLTKTYKTSKDTNFIIKENTISDFIESAEADSRKQYSEELIPLERKIIHVALNGYVTADPIHKRTNSLEVSVVQSFGDKKFMLNIQKIIDQYFPYSITHTHTLSLASFIALRDIFKEVNEFLLINITGLVSEVSLIKEGILYETVSIPMGFSKLLAKVATKMNVSSSVALSLIKMYKKSEIETTVNEKLLKIMEEYRKEWSEKLSDVLSHLSGGVSLPSTCYLISQNQLEELFSEIIQAEDYSQFSFNESKFNVRLVSALDFVQFVDFNKKPLDSTLATGAIVAHQTLFNPPKIG